MRVSTSICILMLHAGVFLVNAAEPGTGASEVSVRTIETSNFDADLSPGESTTNVPAELDEIYGDNVGYFDGVEVRRPLDDLYRRTGLRVGAAYTMLYLQPMGGRSSEYGAAGDFDLLASWEFVGRGTADTGRLVMSAEYRFAMGAQPPSAVGAQMGTLIPPTAAFNDRGFVVRDFYWVQRMFDGRFRLLIGRTDAADFIGSHWLQNVNNAFVNRHFSANPTLPTSEHGPAIGLSFRPNDAVYLTAGVSNAYSRTIRGGVDSLVNEWDFFSFGEVGYTPTFESLGVGRYALGLWHIDSRDLINAPSSYGVTAVIDQNLGDRLQVFARYAYSEASLTNVRHLAQSGIGLSALLGRSDDLTGLAFSLAVPGSSETPPETVLETFHRFQVTQNAQFSLGFQLIANPANAYEDGAAGVFYMRLRTSF